MINVILFLASYFFMEFIAWFSHKYVMHGFAWRFHRDHHIRPERNTSFFQKNDIFFLIYATPAIILIIAGIAAGNNQLIIIGSGFTLYGFTYFSIHDVLIHKRLPVNFKIESGYISALVRAHQAHHSGKNIRDFKNFGLLIFPRRFFNK